MGECQLPVLCLDNSGGPSQFEPLSLPVAPSVMGPHIVLFSSPISFSPLLAPAFWDHPPNQLPSQILLAGGGGGTQDSWHSLFQFIVAHRKFMYFFKLFFLRFSHCLVFSSFLRMCVQLSLNEFCFSSLKRDTFWFLEKSKALFRSCSALFSSALF